MTVSRGYGVSELILPEGSYLLGKSLQESGLHDLDINVLTLYRGSKVIPNPKASRVLEAGDKLLCFGKLESMRTLIPPKTIENRSPLIAPLP
ncbi:cation:proton antiporter regulatory subunit [Bowmanella denitrificans]|uniref:cation:proton antiporter regulatory subunit n=1 Tax=Bowmanella denitrificans TaxID=366582 RepID=UPI003CD07650